MEFRILGPMEAVQEGEAVSLPGGRARTVLALLILNAGQVVSTDRLIDELWGGQPPVTANTALQGLVSKLRKSLEPDRAERQTPTLIETRGPGYVLAIDDGHVDANRFRRLLDEAMTLPAEKKASRLRAALGLWRGAALADFTYEPFAQAEITALEGARMTALEERIDADLELGRHTEVVAELEALVSEHPLRERLHSQLMLALYRTGRQAEALEVYQRLRRTLVEELGIEPGPSLQGLETAILRQDPSLEARSGPRPSPQPGAIGGESREESWLPPGRKTVSVVFVDLALTHTVGWDAEARRRMMGRGYDLVAEVLERHGGTIQGFLGDVVVAVFGLPTAHEDDAWRAVRAATELRRDLVGLNDELHRQEAVGLTARVGIETGEVVVGRPGTGGPPASGDAVSIAARLQQAAGAEEILVGETTRRLLGNAAQLEPAHAPKLDVAAWRLVNRVLDAPRIPDSRDAPMVGRGAELSRLRSLFDRTVRDDEPVLLTVVGEAGIGKSRLAAEFASTIESESLVLTGHCPPYGEGITFAPLRELVLQAIDDSETDGIAGLLEGEEEAESIATQVAGVIGLTDQVPNPRGAFPALRRFFEVLARRRPTVLVFEDLHWARSTLLDLIDYLAESIRGPVMLLCLARSGSPDQRLPGTERDPRSLVLARLEPEESEQLITDRLVGRTLPEETMAWIRETAHGNPLFIEQLVAALCEQPELAIPPSLQSLLAARLDRLGPAERDLLRCASVAGVNFSREVLTALVPTEASPFLDRHLEVLQYKELIRPSSRRFLGEPAFAFRHVLIREAAYRSVGRLVRSQLHERLARWLERERSEAADLQEITGYHLEQACEERRHLGLDDEHIQTLALDAGERLAGAGLQAFAKFDAAAAEDLLSRAALLLPPNHRQKPEVNSRLAEAHTVMGRHRAADAVLAELAEKTEDVRLGRFVRIERARIRLAIGPDPTSLDSVREEATLILETSEQAEDQAGMAQAFFLLALIHLRSGELEAMEKAARQGLACADRSGSAREELGARLVLALALELGPTPVEACIDTLGELVRWRETEHPLLLSTVAHLQAMLGSFDEARRLLGRARRLLREQTRARRPLGLVHHQSAQVELLAGEVTAAQSGLRAALDLYLDMGEPDPLAQIAASLSRVLSIRGDHREAAKMASLGRGRAPLESVAAQALWRVATARVITHRDPEEAGRLARQAVDLVPTEMPNLAADLRLELAEILGATGQDQTVRSLVEEAKILYEGKGNLVGVARAEASRT